MAAQNINHVQPFADWLSISYPTSASPLHEFISFFTRYIGITEIYSKTSESLYRVGEGTLKILHKDEYENFAFSGGVLRSVREKSDYSEFQRLLASAPHNVSRLDIAYDLPVSGALTVRNIRKIYPHSKCTIAGHPRSMQYILSNADSDNDEMTGTVYFQNKRYSGNILLKVYDKLQELKSKLDLTPDMQKPTTRYELTIKRGASLRDFSHPSSCFWHFIPTELLRAPKGLSIAPWFPTSRISYDESSNLSKTDYEAFKYLVQNHSVLQQLISQARLINGGHSILLNEVKRISELSETPTVQ